MNIPVYFKLDPEGGVLEPVIELIRFVNEKSNEVSERAWVQRTLTRADIEQLTREQCANIDVDAAIVTTVGMRVAEAYARNGGAYLAKFDACAPLLLREDAGIIRFEPRMSIITLMTLNGEYVYGSDGFPLDILDCQTGEYGLILEVGGDGTDLQKAVCYLGVLCDVLPSSPTARMVEWMPRPARPEGLSQRREPPTTLQEIIPPDHPVRDLVSPVELAESPFFTVKQLAVLMNVGVGRLYPKIERGEIVAVRDGNGVKIPRAEFTRIAALIFFQNAGTERAIRDALPELEEVARLLRQAVEPVRAGHSPDAIQ
jgi:excisionase family DNA binding protein